MARVRLSARAFGIRQESLDTCPFRGLIVAIITKTLSISALARNRPVSTILSVSGKVCFQVPILTDLCHDSAMLCDWSCSL
jgi:hypothetical protein